MCFIHLIMNISFSLLTTNQIDSYFFPSLSFILRLCLSWLLTATNTQLAITVIVDHYL